MRPNLAGVRVDRLSFHAELALDGNLVNEIHRASEPDEDGDSVFLDVYTRKGRRHGASVWVISSTDTQGEFHIMFNYTVGEAERLPRGTPRILQLIDILSNIKEPIEFQCQAFFEFPKEDDVAPIIPLPLRLMGSPIVPFDEVRGLHVVKRKGDELDYSVALDTTPDGALIQNATFSHFERFSTSLVGSILMRAIDISGKFVVKK